MRLPAAGDDAGCVQRRAVVAALSPRVAGPAGGRSRRATDAIGVLSRLSAIADAPAFALARPAPDAHRLRPFGGIPPPRIAGNDPTVIRDYLGHASVATTNRYISSDLQMKREALDRFWRRAGLSSTRAAPWKPKPDLLAFLTSL